MICFSALPHGAAAMSTEMKGLVETFEDPANVKVEEGMLKIVTSQRSSVMSKLHALTHKIEVIAGLARRHRPEQCRLSLLAAQSRFAVVGKMQEGL